MYTTNFANVAHLPVSRNPKGYLQFGSTMDVPKGAAPNLLGVKNAANPIVRPSRDVRSLPRAPAFPLVLEGVAPADKVPVAEKGTRPSSAVRAFISTRSDGAILYQSRENGAKDFNRPK